MHGIISLDDNTVNLQASAFKHGSVVLQRQTWKLDSSQYNVTAHYYKLTTKQRNLTCEEPAHIANEQENT